MYWTFRDLGKGLPEAGFRTLWCTVPNWYQDENSQHAFPPDESAMCALEQGPSWSTLDFGASPKLSQHFVRRAYAPVPLWGYLDRRAGMLMVHLTNDLAHPIEGGEMCIACRQ